MSVVASPLTELWDAILTRNPRHRSFLEHAIAGLRPDEEIELEHLLLWAEAQGHDVASMAEAYHTIVQDTLREQGYFTKHGRYRYSRLEDVANAVYHDRGYMDRYMRGLALSSYLWPNHAAMRRYFERTMPTNRTGTYLEVGPGHGFYFVRALRDGAFDRCVGVDLAATSLELTATVVDHFAPREVDRAELVHGDFTDPAVASTVPGGVDAFVMGEVLEHVEDPQALLARIAGLCHPETWIHVTTCMNAPAVDHIYLFETAEEVEAMIVGAGLVVEDRLLVPYVGKTVEESVAKRLPVNVSYNLRLR